MEPRILLVEDDPLYAGMLFEALTQAGYKVEHADTVASAVACLELESFAVAILDVRLPDGDGLDLLRTLLELQPGCSALVMTGHASVESAVDAMKIGAADYLPKPFPTEVILLKLKRLLRARRLEEELEGLRARASDTRFVGQSPRVRRLLSTVRSVAPKNANVLIQGESGTGKELIAEMLHRLSPRAEGPFVRVNCGAIPESLLESELFGHERGAFTGADRRRRGMLEQAHGGTLFLDEVGEIPPAMQVKLLRALQERRIRRIGGESEIEVDFRLVAATNRDVEDLVRGGEMREDFYFRIAVIPLEVPPLRDRPGDIPLLAQHFVARLSRIHGTEPVRLSPEALDLLAEYPWPGNVRELENVIERLQVLTPGDTITPRHLPPEVRRVRPATGTVYEVVSTRLTLREAVHRFERRFIEQVLAEEGGNRTAAAARLGISRKNLWEKLGGGSVTGR
ncbi:sigma-54-dependent transcriptional regulator [Deferrisoma camini]|uniref:sigma-54-dependent transcriptional regulator n=1 Tax=Deferrisoma camini TaxID=1035120 RepID=UPI00046CC1E2|nr:sigma-54 dependent transcriptional regulator [Deferrisoma camini]